MHQQQQSCNGMFALLLLCLAATTCASQCPQGPGCSDCNIVPNGEYEIVCRNNLTRSAFIIKYKPNYYVSVTCKSSPNWQDFHLGEITKVEHVNVVHFKMCEWPKDNQLSDIVRKLVAKNVIELNFQSYDNLTSTLSRSSLKNFYQVEKLTLSSNSLAAVTDDLLNDLPNLKTLNLRENNLNELPINFLNIPTLEILELSNNHLEVIEERAFEKLERLQLLNLWKNKLVEIKPHSFDKLTALLSMDLQNNRLTTLPSNIFSRLSNIRSINLSKNNFSFNSLPDDLLHNNTNLENIKISENIQNLTTLPNKFFGNLPKLLTVTLRRSGLIHLPEDLFWGTNTLTDLNIERNYLVTLPLQFFRDCKNLTTLDLNFNDIEYLPDGIFAPLRKLTSLNLSKNRISSITSNLLLGMSSLEILNMERNNMIFVDPHALRSLQRLRVAKFSYNQLTLMSYGQTVITEFGSVSPFEQVQTSLEELYLAYNNITEIFSDWKLSLCLNTLDLRYNKLHYIRTEDLQFLSSNVNIDLNFNQIEKIQLVNNIFLEDISPRNIVVNLENNPINCDCNIYNVLRYREGRLLPAVQNQFDLRINTLKCHGPEPFHGVALSDIESKSFVCAVESFHRNVSCPSPCACGIKLETKAFLIDCAGRGLAEAPKTLQIPSDFNNIHVELNLSNNYLTRMPAMSEWGYDKVTVLSLANNSINDISVNDLSKNLQVLHLQSNNLTRLDSVLLDVLTNSTKLQTLTLDGNNWICDCETRDFLKFIQTALVKMPELQRVTCSLLAKPIFEITPEELCPMMIEWIIGGCIGVAILGIIIGCIAAMYYRYQREIKMWLFAHQCCLRLVTENELDKDKLYDAFISYSHKDDDFVINNLVAKLENGSNPFKLCVHYRDWLAGEWIPTQIARSVDDSRRTIVVLSPNFMESIWGRMEFRAAHKQALSDGRARLIVILYGDIGPTESLDPELKSYLSMNTYIRWGDPWFWEKLRYALPHRTDLMKKKTKKQSVFQTHQPKIHMGNDKSELINTSGNSGTLSGTTSTPPYNTLNTVISIDNEISKDAINEALTRELNGSSNGLAQSVTLPFVDHQVKSDVKSVKPQWTNV